MVLLFYDHKNSKVYIATKDHPLAVYDVNDPKLIDFLPNDTILYIQEAHIITKSQIESWLSGSFSPSGQAPSISQSKLQAPQQEEPVGNRKFLHTTHGGAVHLTDIQTERFPEGVFLTGKYDFVPVDAIGEDVLEESGAFKYAQSKGKIEIVDESYVKANAHRARAGSITDQALDKILVKDQEPGSARAAAVHGGIHSEDFIDAGQPGGHGPSPQSFEPSDDIPIEIDIVD